MVNARGVRVGLADVDLRLGQDLFDGGHGERVVAVAVGEEDVFERNALLLHEREELFRLVTRVDERGKLRLLVNEQVAIRLQRADDGGDDFHKIDLRSVTWELPDPSCPR